MADSLFDNQYRYDFIYPRGRSGETLRAVDSYDNNLPVVIKRPAPNDAPPIRAGQEVSITNEGRALQRLTGHPVLTELLGQGQFFVGGMPHQYIVMERAVGDIISDVVLQLNANGERLPELEMLVIIDQLLDLLHAAHAKDIVYNDVDAKHLFWNRDDHQLKVIDWGNAIFLEGDEVTQQGISRQTDVYQVGELLYFIVTGGRRVDIARDAATDFVVDFGDDNRRVHSRLQEIISKALHPNVRLRYPNITALRSDLTTYRAPIERERNQDVAAIAEQLKNESLPMSELRALMTRIEPLSKQDAGYAPTQEAYRIIRDRLRDLSVEADLDAVQIYMQNGNWNRSAELIRDLRKKAGSQTSSIIDLMLDICIIMTDSAISNPTPEPIQSAIDELFQRQHTSAANILLQDVADDQQRLLQWQIAERISSHMPEVLLLRPNLYRINTALRQMAMDGYAVDEARALLNEIDKTLNHIADGALNLSFLRDSYRAIVDNLTTLNPLLQTFAAQHQLSTRRVPINALERALSAAMALADNMHVIGKQATQTREALHALEVSRTVDPTNPVWNDVSDLLERLYERLQSSQTYVPAADGSDLDTWLTTTQNKLQPFQDRLFDDMLTNMVDGLQRATKAWETYQDVVIAGNRLDAVNALEQAIRSVSTISPALSQWFRQLRAVVEGANYVERHALPGGLGRALADGWAAYDRGRLAESERLGQQAFEIGRNETARVAARRLQDISRLTRDWVERNGVTSATRSRASLEATESLFSDQENQLRFDFEAQMPSIETYLKAMSRGLVATFAETTTAGLRTLYFFYVLQGTLDVHDNLLTDGEFWREAAVKTLEGIGDKHIATRTLDEYIVQRRDLIEAQRIFSHINGKHILPELAATRNSLESNAQARALSAGIQSLRDLELALRHWSDGDFRNAGLKLEDALRGASETESASNLNLEAYRAWLLDLMEHAATLTVRARDLRETIESRPAAPEDTIAMTLNQQVTITEQLAGSETAATLRQWRDTYEQFTAIYVADERRSRRLEQLNEFFRALFIDQHPVYPLYRHWYSVLEAQSEFAAPETNDPVPREQSESDDVISEIVYRNDGDVITADVTPPRSRNIGQIVLFGVISLIAVIIIGVIGINILGGNDTPIIALTISATPNDETQVAVLNVTETEQALLAFFASETALALNPVMTASDSPTRDVTPTIIATATNERVLVIETASPTVIPSDTPTATATNTPTPTLTPSLTPTTPPATTTPLPEGGVRGRQDLLALFNRSDNLPFNLNTFFAIDGGYQLETDANSTSDGIRIVPSADFLNTSYGNNAPSRITSIEADISLLTFNPTLLNDEAGVFFAISLESALDGNNIGLQINALNNTTITVFETQNNTLTALRTRSVGSIVVRLRIDRNIETGEVLLYLNDEQLTPAIDFFDADTPIVPVLSVRDGGVIIRVTDWRIRLR